MVEQHQQTEASDEVTGSGQTAETSDAFPHTDYGNAERLVATEGGNLMYVPGPGWFAYNGKRWVQDEDGRVMRRAKRTVRKTHASGRKLVEHAASIAQEQPEESAALAARGEALMRFARKSESQAGLKAMISLAQSEQKLISQVDELDANPFLLNVANGTVDLRTGDLLMPQREHKITKWSQVVYDPKARDAQWEAVLTHVGQGHDGLVDYLRLAYGYSATGSVEEDLTWLIDGPGGTVKSTLSEAVRSAVGDYGTVAPFDMFVQRKGDQAHPTDLARLVGKRLVTSEEGPKNRALDAAKVKNLSGGTMITARFMRGDFFEYNPVLKLWLVSNYRPRVHAEDTGAWRRLRAVPFTNVLPESAQNKQIRGYLKSDPAAQSAVLAWLVSGARDWYTSGRRLQTPECVRVRTAEWRRDTDRVGGWLEDCCELEPDAWESSKTLQESINTWWKTYVQETGWDPPSLMAGLGDELRARGCRPERRPKSGGPRGWAGIRLRQTSWLGE